MKTHSARLEHIEDVDELAFAAVQLAPPDLIEQTANKTYEWQPARRVTRIQDLRNILSALRSLPLVKRPSIVVFSEYSVPRSAFEPGLDWIDFQQYSSQEKCIIVAGSYFDDRPGPTFQNNLCHVFLPGRDAPITICKAEASPGEKEILKTASTLANGLRLLWKPQGRKTVSISIFLCRDYLTAFERQDLIDEDRQKGVRAVSELDWNHEGINIAVLNNRNPALFEGAAGLDVRDLHGKRKIVLLVNSSNQSGLLATALLCASKSPDREADVAAKLLPSDEGVLIVHARLWEVGGRRLFPDTSVSVPVSHWAPYSYSRADGILISAKKDQQTPSLRGIFHPAFLEALKKDLVIEFFVARSVQFVERAILTRKKIRHVTASHVRGIEDIMIRRYVDQPITTDRYVDQRTTTESEVPSRFSLPFSRLKPTEFKRAFDTSSGTPHLTLLVEPRKILKIRGAPVPKLEDPEWTAKVDEILRELNWGTRERDALSYSQIIPEGEEFPSHFRSLFSLGVEPHVPVGVESGKRDVYLLVSAEDNDGSSAARQFAMYVNSFLLKDPNVRDIYQVDKMRVEPERNKKQFDFVLRLKCSAFETDQIIRSMQEWGEGADVRIGTRSYDLWQYIKKESIEGIPFSRMSSSEENFLVDIYNKEPEAEWNLGSELRERIADAIRRHSSDLRRLGKLGVEADHQLKEFYYNLVLFNIESPEYNKKKYFEDSQKGWTQLFKYFERWSKALLADAVGCSPDIDNDGLGDLLLSKFPIELENKPRGVRNDPAKMFTMLYGRLRGDVSKGLTSILGDNEQVQKLRNLTAHGGHEAKWDQHIRIVDDEWEPAFEKETKTMCKLLIELHRELEKRKIELFAGVDR